jgi:hypothetical protein
MPDDVDRMIREALRAVARPGDPTGVADAIRARLGGPDGGGPAGPGAGPGGTGGPGAPAPRPGWGAPARAGAGSSDGTLLGGLVAAASGTALVVGLVLGANGAFGLPTPSPAGEAAAAPVASGSVAPGPAAITAACPGGEPVGSVTEGDRVLVLGTHDGWAAIRDPRSGDLVWVPSAALVPDEGQPEPPRLAGCTDVVGALAAPDGDPAADPTRSPEADPTTDPTADPATGSAAPVGPTPGPTGGPSPSTPSTPTQTPTQPPDTTPPTLGAATVHGTDPTWGLFPAGTACQPQSGTLQVTADDDRGVTEVTASRPGGGTVALARSGSTWSGPVGGFDPSEVGTHTITVTAVDAAGNVATTQATVTVTTCLI